MKYEITVGEATREVEIEALGEETADGLRRYRLRLDGDGPWITVERGRAIPDVLSLLIDGRSWEAGLVQTTEGFDVELIGVRHVAEVVDPRRKALRMAAGGGGGAVVCQMSGRIVAILVSEGEAVQKGQPVVVVEAMKMENQLKAPTDGVIKHIRVKVGDLVEARTTLIDLAEG